MKLLNRNLTGAAILAGAALLPGVAFANTAANTTITNTVTVNFDDAGGNAQTAVEASVAITVDLVAAAPTLVAGADIDPTTETTAASITYTITSNANGPDQYNLSSDTATNSQISAPTGVTLAGSVTLGATTLAAALVGDDSELTLTVPFDGTDDGVVNGLTDGDTVVINGNEYTIDTVDESNGTTTNLASITLTVEVTGGVVAIGALVAERQTFDINLTTGSIVAPNASGVHTVSVTATSDTDNAFTATDSATITVRKPTLSVTKFVRNVTEPVVGGGTTTTVGADTFYTTGVSGKPTDVMEYLIVVANDDVNAGSATNIVVSDPIPMFTSFVAGSIQLDPGTGTFAAQDEAVDDGTDAAELDSSGNGTVYVYAGAGGSDIVDDGLGGDLNPGAGNGNGGSLAAGETSRVLFQVEID
ncbi:MAG TPA: hypothetical protein VIN71_01530 [Pseudomonadales bacterium]